MLTKFCTSDNDQLFFACTKYVAYVSSLTYPRTFLLDVLVGTVFPYANS